MAKTETHCILSLDQGTTSSRAILFETSGVARHTAQQEFTQHFPQDGWVEHDGEEIWQTTLSTAKNAIAYASQHGLKIIGLGITNQRETTLVWDRTSGKPISRAIVWQDRRTASMCQELKKQDGLEKSIQGKTGLLLDPYFSATKLKWILDNVDGAKQRAAAGELAFGTVDSFLIWRLTGGKVHASDATNASRTMLFNIHGQEWDTDILKLLDIPSALLPQVLDCAADYGTTDSKVLGEAIPIAGVAGDQQAALMGQACFEAGMGKATFGTGAFMIVNTGGKALTSKNKLLTTIAYRLGGEVAYGVEGSIFIAGSGVQWLRDGLGVLDKASDSEGMAAGLSSNHGIYIVPAFTGLGAPYWDAEARGGIFGITRDTQPAHLARAMLEAVCYQTSDLLTAMGRDGLAPTQLRVDGGMVANNWLCQYLADILGISVERPQIIETTALGAAFLAGLQVGVYSSLADCAATWQSEAVFAAKMEKASREQLLAGWQAAVGKVRSQ